MINKSKVYLITSVGVVAFLTLLAVIFIDEFYFPTDWPYSSYIYQISRDELHLLLLPILGGALMLSLVIWKHAEAQNHRVTGLLASLILMASFFIISLSLPITLFLVMPSAIGLAYDYATDGCD